MDEQAKEEQRRYQREWRRKNKDKVRAINQRYWAKRARKRQNVQAHTEKEAKTE